MLIPKRTKYRYNHALKYEGNVKGHSNLSKGDYGLVAKSGAYISNRVIEAARKVLSPHLKKSGFIWINIFPHLAKTKKAIRG